MTGSFSFETSPAFKHPRRVLNVVPGDFTHTGKLDLLVMSEGESNGEIDLTLYPALVEGGFGAFTACWYRIYLIDAADVGNPLKLPSASSAQPIPIDIDGDMRIDLLGRRPSDDELSVWQNAWNSSDPETILYEMYGTSFCAVDALLTVGQDPCAFP